MDYFISWCNENVEKFATRTFLEHSWKFLGTFEEFTRNILGTFEECSRNVPEMVQKRCVKLRKKSNKMF